MKLVWFREALWAMVLAELLGESASVQRNGPYWCLHVPEGKERVLELLGLEDGSETRDAQVQSYLLGLLRAAGGGVL